MYLIRPVTMGHLLERISIKTWSFPSRALALQLKLVNQLHPDEESYLQQIALYFPRS